jgi:HlyD family secretion protein
MRHWISLLIVATLAGGAAYYFWILPEASALDVQTVTAARGDVRRTVATSGPVRALVTVEVGSQLSGQIGDLNADFNTEVKTDEVLARIEPSTFETRVREEEAAGAVAKANVDLQTANVKRAQANLHKARLDYSRAKELVKRGATSQAQLDAAEAAQESAEADLIIAKAQVENAKATALQRAATLDSARIDLERTYIRSPIDGVVIERSVELGQTVAASLQAPTLFTIAQDLSEVQIEAQVDEADIGQVGTGNPVTFTVDAYPDQAFKGTVEQIRLAPVSLQNVVTYTVIIAAENPHGRLLPGMTANVEILTGERSDVVVVPNEALRFEPRGAAERLVAQSGMDAAIGPRGTPGGQMLTRLAAELELTPEQVDRVRTAIEAEFANGRAAGMPGSALFPDHEREQRRIRIGQALRTALTPEQYRRYEERQRQRPSGGRQSTVWTYERGALVPRRVQLGLADSASTEVAEGLEEGDRVVTRVRETRQ